MVHFGGMIFESRPRLAGSEAPRKMVVCSVTLPIELGRHCCDDVGSGKSRALLPPGMPLLFLFCSEISLTGVEIKSSRNLSGIIFHIRRKSSASMKEVAML